MLVEKDLSLYMAGTATAPLPFLSMLLIKL